MNDFNTLNDMPMGAPQGAPQMAPPTGMPGPGPMAPPPEELPMVSPKMMPKPIREGIVGPSLPPMQLIKTRNGYGWIIGGDYSRVWTGTAFEKL